MNIVNALHGARDACAAVGVNLFVLLDSAPNENAFRYFERHKIAFESLFEHTTEASLLEIAPLLFNASELPKEAADNAFKWLQPLAYANPCLLWFRSPHSLEQVAEHLRQFHVVGISEGQKMIMRWYDTRILPIWLACLAPGQSSAFMANTELWQYMDRHGEVRTITEDPPQVHAARTAAPAFGEPLITLDDTQLALLTDGAELDVLLGHLRRIIPDELGQVDKKRLAAFVSRYQQEAIAYGLKDIDRQTQFVILALYTSGRGIEQPEFKAYMKHAPASNNAFSDGLQALPDSVWKAGQPLWEASSRRGQSTHADEAPKHV